MSKRTRFGRRAVVSGVVAAALFAVIWSVLMLWADSLEDAAAIANLISLPLGIAGMGFTIVATVPVRSSRRAPHRGGVAPCPSRIALQVNQRVLRGLSPAARALYSEELLDEVYDLADRHATRRAQVACALRQLTRIWQLRVAARAASSARAAASSASGE